MTSGERDPSILWAEQFYAEMMKRTFMAIGQELHDRIGKDIEFQATAEVISRGPE